MLSDSFALPFIQMSWVIIFYTLWIGYIILRLVGTLSTFNIEDKSSYLNVELQKILIFVSALYTFFLGYFSTFQMLLSLRKYLNEDSSSINLIFVVVKFILVGLPIIFTVQILLAGIMLLKTMVSNHMREEEITAAYQMGIISRRTVYMTVLTNITLNIMQFLLSRQLNDTAYILEISVIPLIIAFAAMILSGYFRKTKELYEDNEMII